MRCKTGNIAPVAYFLIYALDDKSGPLAAPPLYPQPQVSNAQKADGLQSKATCEGESNYCSYQESNPSLPVQPSHYTTDNLHPKNWSCCCCWFFLGSIPCIKINLSFIYKPTNARFIYNVVLLYVYVPVIPLTIFRVLHGINTRSTT